MHTGKQKQMNASYQTSLVNRHIRRFTGKYKLEIRWHALVCLTIMDVWILPI